MRTRILSERARADSLQAARAHRPWRRVGLALGGISTAFAGGGPDAVKAQATAVGGSFSASRRTAPTGGLFVELSPDRTWSLQPELLVSAGGATLKVSQGGAVHEEVFERTLLELPVLVRWQALRTPGRSVWLYAAPSLAWRAGSRGAITTPLGTTEGNLDAAFRSVTARYGLGAEARFGAREHIGWWLDARWISSAGAIFEDGATAGDVSESGFALFVGVGR